MVDSLLTAFEEIIHGMQYPDEGFGAVIKADGSNQVIVWKQGFAVYDQTTGSQGSFKSVHDFDPNLASHDLTQNRVIKYTDSAGDVWLVSCTPFFDNSSYSNPNKKKAFVILVWVKYSVASASLQDLKHRTDHSASSILLYDLIVTFAIGLAVYVIVSLTSLRLHLIDSIIAVARQLIRLQGQEEADRDYADVCNAADRLRETQQDELGLLAIEFSSVVSMLKEENEARLMLYIKSSGKSWMKNTSDNIQAQTIENLRVITSAKSTVIKLFFQKLTVQTMLGANYTTKLMAGNLALPNWNREGGHLQSYSVDPYNNYWCPFKSNRFSGYYMKSDIKSTSQDVEKNIDRAVGKMVIALAISGAVLFLIIIYVSKRVVDNVVYPLEMLRRLCQAILRHDLSANIALQGTSADMTVLLETFSSFLIAIRFSSTSADSIRDHPEKCKYIFDQALEVFESTGNKRGAGACLNNLGSVYFSNSNLPRAADYFDRSIANAKSLLEKSSSESERENLRKILSDRLYNSSLVLIERGRFPEAFGVLEEASKEDLRNGYIRGYISKQIAIGQLQLKQGENGTAARLFQNVLAFFNEVQDSPIQLDKREVMIARQMALRNMGYFYESTANFRAAEYYYLQALCRFTCMHVGTTKKTALSLLNIWGRSGNEVDKIRVLTRLCKRFNLDIDDSRAQRALVPKRVVFAMDYSGSMSGDKIRTAVSSLLNFYDKYIREDDSCALIVFNHKAVEAVKLNKKRLGGDRMRKKISALTAPHGGTALFAAIVISVETLGVIGGNDWVVALTDGQDNGDKSPLLKLLRESSVGLIVIGVGEDVEENVLIELCEAVSEQKGHYVSATSDPKSIEAAFNQVADIIQTDVVFQDIY
eukprot:gene465-492_t